MNKLDFCPNCGTKLDAGDEFCPNCGLDLKKYIKENMPDVSNDNDDQLNSEDNEQKVTEPAPEPISKPNREQPSSIEEAVREPEQNMTEFKPHQSTNKPKNNKSWIAIVIVIVILVGGYFLGKMYYSEDRQEQTLQDELTSGTTSKMQNSLIDSKGNQVSNKQIGALKRLYLKDSSAIRDIESQISENQVNNVFSLKEDGKYLLLYPKYKVAVRSKTLMVNTNINNPSFTIDGKSVASKAINGEYRISGLTPGIYDLKVTNANKSSETKQKQISISVDNNDATITMNVKESEKEPVKTVTKVVKEKSDDSSVGSDDNDSSSSSNESLVGKYSGDPDLDLYSDGNYDLGDKSGTYDILENNDGHVKIRFNQDGGGSIVESYYYSDGELHSSKYDQSWYKD